MTGMTTRRIGQAEGNGEDDDEAAPQRATADIELCAEMLRSCVADLAGVSEGW